MGRIALVALVAMVACGNATGRQPAGPTSAPSQAASPPAPAPPASGGVEFTAVVAATPGTLVRFGPGMDMPAVDVDPAGRLDTFDAWVRRSGDPPQADAVTGRIEWWSRDWFHLADGRGWISSSAVQGLQPASMAQSSWARPANVPAPTAALLDIPLDLQDQPVTCEIASLKMALGYRGIRASEGTLLELTGVDIRPAELGPQGQIVRWGDPYKTFVGDPAGTVSAGTGYGVYAGPIARAAVEAEATVLASGVGIAPAHVYRAVLGGHPVLAWVTSDYRPASLDTWATWDGAVVPYTLTEHVVLVIGVSPTTVFLDDPWSGQTGLARSGFEATYATFHDMAVVIG